MYTYMVQVRVIPVVRVFCYTGGTRMRATQLPVQLQELFVYRSGATACARTVQRVAVLWQGTRAWRGRGGKKKASGQSPRTAVLRGSCAWLRSGFFRAPQMSRGRGAPVPAASDDGRGGARNGAYGDEGDSGDESDYADSGGADRGGGSVQFQWRIVDVQRSNHCALHALNNVLQRMCVKFSPEEPGALILHQPCTGPAVLVLNVAYVLRTCAELRRARRAADAVCAECAGTVSTVRCFGCMRTAMIATRLQDTKSTATKAALAAAAECAAPPAFSDGGAMQAAFALAVAAAAEAAATAAAERAVYEVVRLAANCAGCSSGAGGARGDCASAEQTVEQTAEQTAEQAAEQTASASGAALPGAVVVSASEGTDASGLPADGQAASFEECLCDATGNLSADGVDAMLGAVGLHYARRSVAAGQAQRNLNDVSEDGLEAYERSGYIGLIAFLGSCTHYVALRYSTQQGCYVYLDSIVRRYARQGAFVNCGLYTRKAVVQWLNTHCYHLQDGVARAAFVWALSSRRLPTVHADRAAPPAAPPAGASTSAGTSTVALIEGEDGGARKVARIF